MPPKRKSAGGRAANTRRQQSTLTFNGKSGGISKPGVRGQDKSAKKIVDGNLLDQSVRATDVQADEPRPQKELDEPTTAEKAIEEQVEREAESFEESAHDPLTTSADGNAVKVEDVLGGRARESDAGAVGGDAGSGWVGDEQAVARKVTDAQIKKYWRAKEQERLAPRVHQEELTVFEKVLREWDMSGQYGPCIGIARLKRWKRANGLGLKPPIEVLAVLLKEMDRGDVKSQRAHVDQLLSSRFIET